MATVNFRTIDAGRTGVVQFHFVAPKNRIRFEREIGPIHDGIVQIVPERNRHYDQTTLSWQIPRSHWPKVQKLLFDHGLQLRMETHKQNGFREATRDIAQVLCISCLWLGALLVWNFLAHFFLSRGSAAPIRQFLAPFLCLVCFISFRFGKYVQAILSACFAIVFRPIDPIWFKSWWAWQLLNWVTFLLIITFTVRCALAAREERKLDLWWHSLSSFEPHIDED